MKRIWSSLALAVLVATNVSAQPLAPTVKIACTVNYAFVHSYTRDSKNIPALSPQGDYFSGRGFFVTRRSIDLYPGKATPSKTYKVILDAAMHSFLRKACTEDVGQVLRYIDRHEFDATQNVFHFGENGNPLPSRAIERKIGDWNLSSWNNRVDHRVD